MIGNQITLPTWRWLKVNETDVRIPSIQYREYTCMADSEILPSDEVEAEINRYPHGFSTAETKRQTESYTNLNYYIHAKRGEDRPLQKISLPLDAQNKNLIDKQTIVAEPGSRVEVLYDYHNLDDEKGFRNTALRIIARENAHVKVYLVQRHNEQTLAIQSVMSVVYEHASVEVVEVEVGAYQTYFNYRSSLVGDYAKVDTNSVYFGYKEEGLNLFYNFDQIGKKTNSNVIVKGALKDRAHKMFKAALDFKKGSNGSEGNEEEFVTLMSENVNSVAVPLLLCHEDDVVGNHASSAGRISGDTLFYIMSRGISRREAEKMIVESNLMPTVDLIPDMVLRKEIWRRIEDKLDA
ncbi:MAG: SufD family Fe-S cluster assembly protein [Eubacteriales bacterium]|nr:SufD family Fe-S cluster assembly protein [Eubacteriales bacterium]